MPKFVVIPQIVIEAPGEYEAAKQAFELLAGLNVPAVDVYDLRPDGTFSLFGSTPFKREDVEED